MSLRQIVGAFSLVALLVINTFVEFEPVVRGTYSPDGFIDDFILVLVIVWLVTSGILKLSMIFNKRWFKFNALSSIFWVIMMLLIILPLHPANGTANQYSTVQNLSGFFIFFGWFLIDVADKFYLIKQIGIENL